MTDRKMKKLMINLERKSCPALRSQSHWLVRLVKVQFFLSWTYGSAFDPPFMFSFHRELWDGTMHSEIQVLWVTLQIQL